MKKLIYFWIVPICAALLFVSMGYIDNTWHDIFASLFGFALMDFYAINYDKYD